MLEISLFDVLIKVFLEFIILLAPWWFFLLAFRYLKKTKQKKNFYFCSLLFVPVCTMAESSEYNLFYFKPRMQYMWPIAAGYFVNVDFVVLGHSSNKRKGDHTLSVEQILQ